jgi:hypothetical protein
VLIYEAVPTTPEALITATRGAPLPGRPPLPRTVIRKLEAKAHERNEAEELRKWMKQYGGR